MKSNKLNLGLLFALAFFMALSAGLVYATVFTATYDTNTPQGSDNPAEADDRMREIKAAVQERMNVCNYWPLTVTEVSDPDAGENRKVLFHEPLSSPGAIAEDHGQLFIKDVAGKAELHWMDEDEQEIQLTSVGGLYTSSGFTMVTGETALMETIKAIDSDGVSLVDNDDDIILKITNNGFDSAASLGIKTVADGFVDSESFLLTAALIQDRIDLAAQADYAIKGWITFTAAGSKSDGLNATVARNSEGSYTVTWGTNFANTAYAVTATPDASAGGPAQVVSKAVGSCVIQTRDSSHALADAACNVIAIGDQ